MYVHIWTCVKSRDRHLASRLHLDMARGTRPRKIQHHWIQGVVAQNVREAMERDGRSPARLAKDAGIGRLSVERLRDGENSTLTTLGAVADALGMEPRLLMVRKRTEEAPVAPSRVAQFPTYPSMLGRDGEVNKSETKVRDRKKRTR